MTILGVIPARGGSKGIQNKNIVSVKGRPLISYTIGPALEAQNDGYLTEVIVSTDSPEIREVSIGLGARAPFLRPPSIAGDTAKTVDVILHALSYYASIGMQFDAVMILQPTSPMRQTSDIAGSADLFGKNRHPSLISCYRHLNLKKSYLYTEKNCLALPIDPRHHSGVRRQDDQSVFIRNGAIYLTRSSYICSRKRIISRKPLLFEMPQGHSINIDHPEDIIKLERLL